MLIDRESIYFFAESKTQDDTLRQLHTDLTGTNIKSEIYESHGSREMGTYIEFACLILEEKK